MGALRSIEPVLEAEVDTGKDNGQYDAEGNEAY
jgi:hypothetical protein